MAHQYWYPPRSRTRCGATTAQHSVAGEDLRELANMLLEVADHESLEDRRDRHLTESRMGTGALHLQGPQLAHASANGCRGLPDPVHQLICRQPPVVPDP